MILFDYLYYRICRAYSHSRSTSPEATSACIVALIQTFNIVSILMLIGIMRHDKKIISKTFAVGIFLMFLVFNYIRYVYKTTNDFKVMSERYNNEINRTTKGTYVLLYIIVNFGLFLGLAIYGGSQKY
jgi:hypothetical protein